MEQGPVLVISFNAQQIMLVRDSSGKVVEGDPVSNYNSAAVEHLKFPF